MNKEQLRSYYFRSNKQRRPAIILNHSPCRNEKDFLNWLDGNENETTTPPPNPSRTIVHVLAIDSSGSMGGARKAQAVKKDVPQEIQVLNELVADGNINYVLIQILFSSSAKIQEIEERNTPGFSCNYMRNYRPFGGTALNDAILLGIKEASKYNTSNVIFNIFTDGRENNSGYSKESVKHEVLKARNNGWSISLIGSDPEIPVYAEKIGLSEKNVEVVSNDGKGLTASSKTRKNISKYAHFSVSKGEALDNDNIIEASKGVTFK